MKRVAGKPIRTRAMSEPVVQPVLEAGRKLVRAIEVPVDDRWGDGGEMSNVIVSFCGMGVAIQRNKEVIMQSTCGDVGYRPVSPDPHSLSRG
jgi:hypothetical protein